MASGNMRQGHAAPQRRIVFYACKYTPLELLRGFGADVVLAQSPSDTFDEADALAHPNLCGYGKGLICRLTQPDVREVVLVTCCDVVRRVYDVLADRGGYDFLYLLDLPHERGPAEVALLRGRLADLAEKYAAYSGATFDVGRALGTMEPPCPVQGPHVSLLGAHATAELVEDVTAAMGTLVENQTCTGPRRLASAPPQLARAPRGGCGACGDAALGGDSGLEAFLDWYAGALMSQPPCMRMDDIDARAQLRQGATGIVYHTMKFCDYYGFEYSELAREGGTPMLKIETDGTSQSTGQLRTRLEAFGETLGTRSDAQAAAGSSAAADPDAPALGEKTLVMGIDSGSTSTDAVLMDGRGRLVVSVIVPTGARAAESATRAQQELLRKAGVSDDSVTLRVSTGYGRDGIGQTDSSVTEITCHARGARWLKPDVRAIIDIGGQDSKVISLDADGSVANFVMNDKCAAGTGRFMEAMARVLELPLPEFCERGLDWHGDVRISSMCTVFAESEVVSLVAQNTPVADIIHGLDMSVARKTATLAKRVDAQGPFLMTGGVARNAGVVRALEDVLGTPVATHGDSQLCGAIGAALLGLESLGWDGTE